MKKFIFTSTFAVTLAIGLPSVEAKNNSNFRDNATSYFDRNEIGDPYGCYDCTRPWGYYRGPMSCGEARALVRRSGYKNVDTIECRGSTYTFEATRKGRDFTVFVNSRSGALSRR